MNGLPIAAFLAPPAGQSGSASVLVIVWYVIAFGAIFYFLLWRPQRQQQKRHEEMLKELKKGDEVVTTGGIIGKVVHLKDDRVTVESGESRLVIERARVARIVTAKAQETAKT